MDVAILRDVVDRHRVSNVVGLRWLVRRLLGNAGARFSVEKFHRALRSEGIAIARDTVHQHLGYLEDCFLVRTLWMESRSERQRMVNPRKSYPVDAGLISVFDRTGRANTGHALETAVFVELERRRYETTYVRTPEGFDVDFLARGDGAPELIQVCADASTPTTGTRELRALTAAGSHVPISNEATTHPEPSWSTSRNTHRCDRPTGLRMDNRRIPVTVTTKRVESPPYCRPASAD